MKYVERSVTTVPSNFGDLIEEWEKEGYSEFVITRRYDVSGHSGWHVLGRVERERILGDLNKKYEGLDAK